MPSIQAKTVRKFISKFAKRLRDKPLELETLMAELDREGVSQKDIIQSARFLHETNSFIGTGQFAGFSLNKVA
jgi:hypothetical protein